jgi:hypothetical protein
MLGRNRLAERSGAPGDRVLVEVGGDGRSRRILQLRRCREIRKALRELTARLDREAIRLADADSV